jgi:hypothetical protein
MTGHETLILQDVDGALRLCELQASQWQCSALPPLPDGVNAAAAVDNAAQARAAAAAAQANAEAESALRAATAAAAAANAQARAAMQQAQSATGQ